MRNVSATSYLHLLETGRGDNRIYVTLDYVNGDLGRQLNWGDGSVMHGYLEAQTRPDGCYYLMLVLNADGGKQKLDLIFEANFLFDDQAFLGKVNGSTDGIQFFSDQEGGYAAYIYKDGQHYTESWYNHLLGYNDWAIKNGYPLLERSQMVVNSICEAFPQAAYYEI